MTIFHISIDKNCHVYYNTVVFENINCCGEEVTAIYHKYTLIRSDAGGRADVYGIKIETSAGRSVYFPYISENRRDAELLINKMKRSNVASEHIGDIVRDYITELYFEKLQINGL